MARTDLCTGRRTMRRTRNRASDGLRVDPHRPRAPAARRGVARRRGGTRLPRILVVAIALLLAPSARAVLIAGPDGTINTSAPSPDPGFGYVGSIGGLSGVYVGGGWVLTANHVGAGSFVLDGVSYEPIAGSYRRLDDPLGRSPDLGMFKLQDRPPLPDLAVATSAPSVGDEVVMVGNGRNRGAAIQVDLGGFPVDGWQFAAGRALRWGTNRIDTVGLVELGTEVFYVVFDELRGRRSNDPEAQAVPGDSGGAVLDATAGSPRLVGLLIARATFEGQPSDTALFGNFSYAADVSFYSDQIGALVALQDCEDGLDNDGDGQVDASSDPGCEGDPLGASETSATLVCDNGLDDDGDGLVDWPDDDGCSDLLDDSEVPMGVPAMDPLGLVLLVVGMGSIGAIRSRTVPSR